MVGLRLIVTLVSLGITLLAISEWRMRSIDNRLEERLKIYHREQDYQLRKLDHIDARLQQLEQHK